MPAHIASGNQTWLDWPSTSTPITAAGLEAIEVALDRLLARPVAEARLTTNVAMPAVTDLFAQNNWSAFTDTHDMCKLAPGSGTYSYLQVPTGWGGRYYLRYHATTSGLGTGGCLALKIMRGTSVGVSSAANIATANNTVPGTGSDGAVVDCTTEIVLAPGDRIYWQLWVSVACTVPATNLNVPTAIEARYVGPN